MREAAGTTERMADKLVVIGIDPLYDLAPFGRAARNHAVAFFVPASEYRPRHPKNRKALEGPAAAQFADDTLITNAGFVGALRIKNVFDEFGAELQIRVKRAAVFFAVAADGADHRSRQDVLPKPDEITAPMRRSDRRQTSRAGVAAQM